MIITANLCDVLGCLLFIAFWIGLYLFCTGSDK